ncbi:MAG: imidazole glycerol phosphate synthase subunit HisF [Gammaproteobacteria bacterium]
MLARRIIACLDVRDGRVVKGVQFRDHRDMGDIVELATRYAREGVDELVFYDITASPEARTVDTDWVERVCAAIDIPFCVAGGIRSVAQAEQVLAAGADKISINSPALQEPVLINQLAARFGSQCVVVGVDSVLRGDQYEVYKMTGSTQTAGSAGRHTFEWLREAIDRGAGEIVLNCMGSDGVRRGYDIQQLQLARRETNVPLIASGGAGQLQHFSDVFLKADVDGALAATVFHSGQLTIGDVKTHIQQHGVSVRL